MDPKPRWRNLVVAAGVPVATLFAGWDIYKWFEAYTSDHFHNDFTFYLAAARIGLAHGWPSIYDLNLQQAELHTLGSGITVAELARYISPPPLAWLALPLTPLPYEVGYWAWSVLLLVGLAWTWYLAVPGRGPARLIHLCAALGWLPVIYALQLGQPALLVALGVAACCALLRAQRPFLAGCALGVLALKPQLAFLVPAALVASGRMRAFWGSVVTLGLLAAASAVALGPTGVAAYANLLNFAAGVPINRELTLAPIVGSVAVTRVIQAAIALWALVLAYRLRRRAPEWMFIPALVGGLLASPYLHLDDLVMLGLAGWFYLRTTPPAWTWAFIFAIVIAAEGVPIWGAGPMIAGELIALVLLSVESWRASGTVPSGSFDEAPRPLMRFT